MSSRTLRALSMFSIAASVSAAAATAAAATFSSTLIYEANGKSGRIQGNTRVSSVTLTHGKGSWIMRIYGAQTKANAAQGVPAFSPVCAVTGRDREVILNLYAKTMEGVKRGEYAFGCLGTKLADKVGVGTANIVDLATDQGTFDISVNP